VPAALRGLGAAAAAAAPTLVETLRDDDERQEAIEALTEMGAAAVPALLAGLSENNSRLRSRALRTLGFIGPAARAALAAAVRALDDPEDKVRAQAVFALGRLAPFPEAAVAELGRSLKDESHEVRREAIKVLRELGPGAAAATPALVSLLATDDPDELPDDDELIDVVEALGTIGPAAAPAAEPLVRAMLADLREPAAVRTIAALAVWRVCGDKTTAAAALRELAQKDIPSKRRAKPEAANASQVIWGIEERMAADRCRAARRVLFRMGVAAGDCTDFLVAGLRDNDPKSRAAAARAAPDLMADRNVVVPILLNLLDDSDGDSRWQAIQSLLRMGVTDPQVGESMRLAMEEGAWAFGPSSWDDGRCEEAIDLIRALGPAADSLAPLLEHLRDQYQQVRPEAVFALAHVRGDVTAAIPELIAALADTDPPCPCQSAADCLGKIGPAARSAVPHLARMARHGSNYYDRLAALCALRRIDSVAADELRESFS
jgi:HEAT repeat protein